MLVVRGNSPKMFNDAQMNAGSNGVLPIIISLWAEPCIEKVPCWNTMPCCHNEREIHEKTLKIYKNHLKSMNFQQKIPARFTTRQ